MTNLIPGDPSNFPANIRAPSDADLRNATTENLAIQDLADRTAYLGSIQNGLNTIKGAMIFAQPYVNDNNTTGPSPQTVNDSPRAVFDSSGNPLWATNNVGITAGDLLDINIGPLFVSTRSLNHASKVRFLVQFPDLTSQYYELVDDGYSPGAGTADAYERHLINFNVTLTAPQNGGFGSYFFGLFAWAVSLPGVVKVFSPGYSDSVSVANWPNGSTSQQWGRALVIGNRNP